MTLTYSELQALANTANMAGDVFTPLGPGDFNVTLTSQALGADRAHLNIYSPDTITTIDFFAVYSELARISAALLRMGNGPIGVWDCDKTAHRSHSMTSSSFSRFPVSPFHFPASFVVSA